MVVVAVPLLVLFGLLAVLAAWAAKEQLLRPWLEAMADDVPVIGRYIRRAIAAVTDAAGNAWARWLEPQIDRLRNWFDGLATTAAELEGGVAAFAEGLAADLKYLVDTRIPNAIGAAVGPVAKVANDALGLAGRVDDALERFRNRVLDVELPNVARGIDRLRDRLLDVELPRVARGIDRLGREIARVDDRIGDVVLPRLRGAEAALRDVGRDVADLRGLLEGVRAWVVPVAAAFGAVAVVELLRHVARCKPKTDRLCELDLDDWEDMLGLVVAFATIGELVQVMRGVARGADELVDGLRLLR